MNPTALSKQTPRLKKVASVLTTRGDRPRAALVGISLPGVLTGATFSDACAGPLARVGLDSFPAPPAVGATSFRGERFLTDLSAGHYAGRDPLCNSTPRRVRLFVKASRMNVALGLFAWSNVLQDAPGACAKASEQVSESPSVRFQTSDNGGFLCDTIGSQIGTRRST